MKRRNAECGKLRRPLKRNKITEGIYGRCLSEWLGVPNDSSVETYRCKLQPFLYFNPNWKQLCLEILHGCTLLYLKFLLLWAMVILADFILEFRFEFLWSFWLLLRSVYDSFKYQGLAFSVFFICIALTSDMICFFFIPVHWLFFAASTYVWVQYVWHTDKGVCLPTVMLWLLFLYIEAAVRLRDLRHMPFHLDLCRPFAAHCIGYPVVTLGFGFKSYVGYRMRQRKQKDVAKENEFYLQLLQQALPADQQTSQQIQSQAQPHAQLITAEHNTKSQPHRPSPQYNPSPEKSRGAGAATLETSIQNGGVPNGTSGVSSTQNATTKNNHRKSLDKGEKPEDQQQQQQQQKHNSNVGNASQSEKNDKRFVHSNGTTVSHNDVQFIERVSTVNDCEATDIEKEKTSKPGGVGTATGGGTGSGGGGNTSHNSVKTQSNGSATGKWNNVKEGSRDSSTSVNGQRKGRQAKSTIDDLVEQQKQQDKYCQKVLLCRKLEAVIKRLKADLQSSRNSEQEFRNMVCSYSISERQAKTEIQQLQDENDKLQHKLDELTCGHEIDKQIMLALERRMADERRQRTACEASLATERRARQVAEEAISSIPPPAPPLVRQECTDACKTRRAQMDQDLKNLRREIKSKEERCQALEKDSSRCKDNHGETEILLSALSALQDKNSHLENSLSAETRIKLDLFSALGEAKRQLEIRESLIRSQEKEIELLKAKIAQDLAVMPQDSFGPTPTCSTSKLRLNNDVRVGGSKMRGNESPCPGCTVSNLDPNATAYTPKGSLVASTEA